MDLLVAILSGPTPDTPKKRSRAPPDSGNDSDDMVIKSERNLEIARIRRNKGKRDAALLMAFRARTTKERLHAFFIALLASDGASVAGMRSQNIMELLSTFWSFKEECDSEYPEPVNCFDCNRQITGAHLYLVEITKNPKLYKAGYVHWCSHIKFDGSEWCDGCCTLVTVEGKGPYIKCTNCAGIRWGQGTIGVPYWVPPKRRKSGR
jgi:hypothetical protein